VFESGSHRQDRCVANLMPEREDSRSLVKASGGEQLELLGQGRLRFAGLFRLSIEHDVQFRCPSGLLHVGDPGVTLIQR
jgi:hypothetical protein